MEEYELEYELEREIAAIEGDMSLTSAQATKEIERVTSLHVNRDIY